ncbi:hypothetical protein [Endozoicomonas sp. 8E]|uniref:hypothetical protein n=1 Tax=Endozoicomonas sp. 8E TaxID=3035692 RepID=UPI0029394095|nr:hypothetical protein [Endozoicomonas sp. 8E]WOG29708.1 hypothetical protein P6910_08650 [Endozoicomonas sp. 8E]
MQLLKHDHMLLISTMIVYILSHSALAKTDINTTASVNPESSTFSSNFSEPAIASEFNASSSSTVSLGIRLTLTSSDDISYRENKGALSAFICSLINRPSNSTVVYGNSSDLNNLKNHLGCEAPLPVDAIKNKPGYDRWMTSVSVWVWQGIEMFILLHATIKVNPKARKQILWTAFFTSLITTCSLYSAGVALAASGKEIPEKWIRLIAGLTKLKASLNIGGWTLGMAGGFAAEKELVLSGLLMNVISNTFRQTGEGALVTLPLILDKKYAAALLAFIPLGVIASQLIKFNPKTNSVFLQRFSWFVIASLGAGLFSGAWHEFEKIAGESSTVWDFGKQATVSDTYEILSDKKLPMSIIAPFGYRPDPTVITLTSGLGYFTLVTLASLYLFIHRVQPTSIDQLIPDNAETSGL